MLELMLWHLMCHLIFGKLVGLDKSFDRTNDGIIPAGKESATFEAKPFDWFAQWVLLPPEKVFVACIGSTSLHNSD